LGLGLVISRQAVEESGGTIHVRSIPGTGCIFTVDLPRRPRSPS
jgi:signal transduction histidine kinase